MGFPPVIGQVNLCKHARSMPLDSAISDGPAEGYQDWALASLAQPSCLQCPGLACLQEMDGFEPNSGVIVMAATNLETALDPALLRAGRFDRHVAVPLPDVRGRLDLLNYYLKVLISACLQWQRCMLHLAACL